MTDPQFPAPGSAAPASVPPPPPVTYAPPPGAYTVPVGGYGAQAGYGAQTGYGVPNGQYAPPMPVEAPSRGLGVLAMLLSFVAAVAAPAVAGFAAYALGRRLPQLIEEWSALMGSSTSELAFLSPAREQVMWLEISFWTGTVVGVAALVMGIVATVKRRGRPQGVVAIVLSVIAPMIYVVVATTAVSVGSAAGAVAMYGGI